ncbi:glycoside hydrolase family 75 protein [Streptomyces sp. NPDC096176]|uniref:glycoside hydrolase family 75 protein n=1 Tax=Streptomyces sp. NPDC096176 TaxID=3366079 RepID=UPI00382FBB0E
MSTVVLGTTALPAAAYAGAVPPPPAPGDQRAAGYGVDADDLLDSLGRCDQISDGRYSTDSGRPENIPVCDHGPAVSWKADMDIDCDGRRTERCNEDTDPSYLPTTSFTQSDGRYLNSAKLPFIVVPMPSSTWDYRRSGIRGGSLAAIVYRGRVQYAVVGDTGPADIIGEASYSAAKALGIDPDPATGGVPSGVTYIVFKDSRVSPIESRSAAESLGEDLAERFVYGD